ncbi:hypothetical protein EGW08_013716 [Elysia chlorotica]|uniref:MPN domain-containing protein n=1 Tax=Elysia chlorotica TaxID=188477 RepID=A0A3S1B2T6_ELYCH|nr:hypothetical protein EGW08_013716 [Elysia chlorotica]
MESALPEQNQPGPTKDKEEEDEENEEGEDSDHDASSSNEDEESMKKAVQALTCRKVTLNMLMDDGLIEAGDSVLSIDYLGQRFEADLLPSGKIKWQGSEEEFGTPSAWALHCKRLVNPIKRSGCGWASVRYKNKKLDIWKSIWARKQRLSSSSKVSLLVNKFVPITIFDERMCIIMSISKVTLYVHVCRDPFTLIKCENFDSLSKIQPFTVSISSNSLLLMDFHCHLTKSEVVGYLGGRWDCQRQHLSIEQAFPAKCRLGDKDRSTIVEDEIRRSMCQKGMMVVGWYHSHPTCPPDPSLRDLDCQMAYQLRMRGSGAIYLPCVGFILSPFEKFPPKQDSKIQAYWVMPNLEHPTSFNIPMHVTHSVVRDVSLTEDLLADMKALCEFYSGAVDKIRLREQWGEAITYLDKIKASLRSKLPQDQLDSSTFLDYVQQLLGDMK